MNRGAWDAKTKTHVTAPGTVARQFSQPLVRLRQIRSSAMASQMGPDAIRSHVEQFEHAASCGDFEVSLVASTACLQWFATESLLDISKLC